MSDPDTADGGHELQFDRVVTAASTSSTPPSKVAVTCASCRRTIETEYYDVNGHTLCDRCRVNIEASAATPQGIRPLLIAGVFGVGAGIVGAAIYYAVIALANLEIGIVAILIGYMVGYAVRKGADGRGGRRFQVLAVALTYASIALAYTPIAVKQAMADRGVQKTSATAAATAPVDSTRAMTTPPASGGSTLVALAFLLALIAALPVLVVIGSFPSGLISALIIFIGMRQAWTMTGAPPLQILGPFRVGAARTPTSA